MADVDGWSGECVSERFGFVAGEWLGDERFVSDAVHVAVVGYSVGDVHDLFDRL